MTHISFSHIHRDGQVVFETKEYKQFHNAEFLSHYDSNLISWKSMPSIRLFMEVEDVLRHFHAQNKQNHLKFIFPPNEKISNEIQNYLSSNNYSIGFLELYSIRPNDFKANKNSEISVQFVTEENMEDFLELHFNENLQFGEDFAKEKQNLLRTQHNIDNFHQIIAYEQSKPVGSVIVIEKEDTAEIDNLFVLPFFQSKGIGSTIQHFIMAHFHNKTIILVADGEDTPKEMYQRQNYRLEGYQYEAFKVEK